MKTTRKFLSFMLAVLVAVAGMPAVYVSTAAENEASVTSVQTGTKENPTHPIEATGTFSYDDLYKLNIDIENTSYTFYQTQNEEYFTFTQILGLQQRRDSDTSSRTMIFEGVSHYTGATGSTSVDGNGVGQGTGVMEVPAITINNTASFFEKYCVDGNVWASVNENAAQLKETPENVTLAGSSADLTGCKNYSWSDKFVFKGMGSSESGEVKTSFYDSYKWNWATSEESAAFDLRVQTEIRILDARELYAEIQKAEKIIKNSDNYTPAYVSSVKECLKSVPDDLKSFSSVYDQATIDEYANLLKSVSLNAADYRKFVETYEELNAISNANGAYTANSFKAFKDEIAKINKELPKNLDKTQQSVVDKATQDLKAAYELLVATDLSTEDTKAEYLTNEDDGDMSFYVDNTDFKFMQTKDSQVFEYSQMWTIKRTGGTNARKFGGMILQTADLTGLCDNSTCRLNETPEENNTQEFVDRLVSSNYAVITARNEVGVINKNDTTFTAPEFLCWSEHTDATGTADKPTTFIDATGDYVGALDSNRDFEYSQDSTYYMKNSPRFTGNPAGTYGEISMNYVLRTGWSYGTGFFNSTKKSSHIHINSTVTVTDVRSLIATIAQADETIANPGSHTDAYIQALKAAVSEAPEDMLRGVKFYTQAEVDAIEASIKSVAEGGADYTEFNEVFSEYANLENDSRYTEESFAEFKEAIYKINRALDKNLTADKQSVIEAATEELRGAYNKLVHKHMNNDSEFTSEDISDSLGNSPLEFAVSSTEYDFMQVVDGQQFRIETNLTARKTNSSYTVKLLALGLSSVNSANDETYCNDRSDPDEGCHNRLNVPSEGFIDLATYAKTDAGISGITTYDTIDAAGDTGEFSTWTNVSGKELSVDGMFNKEVELNMTDSSAYADFTYTATSDSAKTEINVVYALRLGWSYQQFWGSNIRRHVHIPVSVKITDARDLYELYHVVYDIVKGKTDKNYTLSSLGNLYEAFKDIPEDMANGDVYYSQTDVDAKYNELKKAYDALAEGADYSDYFNAYVEASEIIGSNNKDEYGNSIYDEDTFNSFKATVEETNNALDKELSATQENQATIDAATNTIKDALEKLEAAKRADYTDFEKAMDEAEKILNAPEGTYTDKTIDDLKEIYDNAATLDKNLSVSEQEKIDKITARLENAVANAEYKADYKDFNDAYENVKEIIDAPEGTYTDETVKAAQDAINSADKIDKDLADTSENRETIKNATDSLKDVLDNAQKKADYSSLEGVEEALDEIINAPEGTYTDETVKNAQDAKDAYNNLDKDLPESEQSKIDEVADKISDAINGATKKADYTDYNNAKTEADSMVNDDGNGNPIYDEEAFNEYKDAVNNIDNALNKDLPLSEQETVDAAAEEIKSLKDSLDSKKYYTVTFKNEDGSVITTERCVNGTQFGAVTAPAVPENTEDVAYFAWYNSDGTAISDSLTISGNIDAFIVTEAKKLMPKAESNITIDTQTGFINGVEAGTTVAELLQKFDNDTTAVVVTSYTGMVLTADDLVGTGATVKLVSKLSDAVYETETVVVKGDVDGDGDVDEADYKKAIETNLGNEVYTDAEYCFFVANDMDGNGVINVLDTWSIRMMY